MQKIVQLITFILFFQTQFSFSQTSTSSSNGKTKAFMGVTLGTSWGDGVEISAISENYGAERAGLKRGDIIVALNKDAINNSADFTRCLKKYRPSEEVEVTYLRGKEKNTAKVKLAESPNENWNFNVNIDDDDIDDAVEDLKDLKEDLRENLEDLREDLKDNFRMTEKARIGIYPKTEWSEKAVRITGFTSKSAAKDAGLQKDDLILKIDNDETNTEEELRYALKKHKPNDEVIVTYRRNDKKGEAKVKLGAEKVYEAGCNIYYNDSEGWGSSFSKNDKNNETRTWSSYTFADGTQVDLNDFKISPSENSVNISFEAKLNQPFSVVIYDDNGKEIAREEQAKLDGKFEKKFDLQNNKSNSYFAKLWISGKEAFSQKINMQTK